MKVRKCKVCREPSTLLINLHAFCTYDHAIEWANKQTRKAYKAETVRRKKALLDNDKDHWLEKAQKAFNAYIRARDAGLPCISCGVPDGQGKRNACHFRPAGVNTALRFTELNVHGGCERCNTYQSGNLIGYRVGLEAKIGIEAVQELEADHTIKRWSLDELKEVHRHYTQKMKELQNGD